MTLGVLRNDRGAALIEAAITVPFFVILLVGIVDLGTGMYEAMGVNAAAQAGATYAVLNKGATSGDQSLLNAAADNVTVTATPVSCTDPSGGFCVSVQASYQFAPILYAPQLAKYAPWLTPSLTITSTATVRIE
jgi:Flp pilus assembly protein TadG